jgi:hypothetical protein
MQFLTISVISMIELKSCYVGETIVVRRMVVAWIGHLQVKNRIRKIIVEHRLYHHFVLLVESVFRNKKIVNRPSNVACLITELECRKGRIIFSLVFGQSLLLYFGHGVKVDERGLHYI